MQEAIRQQVSPCKTRLLEEVNDLMTAQGPVKDANPKAKEIRKANKQKLKEMTKAAVQLQVSRFKDRLKGASVSDALAAITLRTTKDGWGKGRQEARKPGRPGRLKE